MLAHVQWFKLNCVNLRINFSIIPDPTEVSEVNEEEEQILSNKEAIGEEESKKEELGTKGDRDDEVIRIYMLVLV